MLNQNFVKHIIIENTSVARYMQLNQLTRFGENMFEMCFLGNLLRMTVKLHLQIYHLFVLQYLENKSKEPDFLWDVTLDSRLNCIRTWLCPGDRVQILFRFQILFEENCQHVFFQD